MRGAGFDDAEIDGAHGDALALVPASASQERLRPEHVRAKPGVVAARRGARGGRRG